MHEKSSYLTSGPEGYLTPNDDYETAIVILDELDKGASKRDLARRTSVARSTIQHVERQRERYVGDPPLESRTTRSMHEIEGESDG